MWLHTSACCNKENVSFCCVFFHIWAGCKIQTILFQLVKPWVFLRLEHLLRSYIEQDQWAAGEQHHCEVLWLSFVCAISVLPCVFMSFVEFGWRKPATLAGSAAVSGLKLCPYFCMSSACPMSAYLSIFGGGAISSKSSNKLMEKGNPQ